MTRKTLVGTALAVLTTVGMLAGCGDNSAGHDMGSTPTSDTSGASGEAPAGEHNAADVTFLQQMIPHHNQAVEMADLVDGRTTTSAVVDLADQIKKAQGPEIDQMTGWLTGWGEPTTSAATPSTGTDHSMPGMDHGSAMPGMMTDEDMAQLKQASGAAFDQQWLTMMVTHHQGAIDMAKAQLTDGANAEVKALAQQIIDAQEAEISQMQTLLPQS